MSNEEINQRIKYLVEHGGLWDDPLGDLRRLARVGVALAAVVTVCVWVNLALHVLF